jgi:uncharacterized protein YbjT (DUF2867 family)
MTRGFHEIHAVITMERPYDVSVLPTANRHLRHRRVKNCVVIGASSGTGLAIVRQLASQGVHVRAVSRHPPEAAAFIEPVAADVTDAGAMIGVLDGDFDAVFYTVDIHGFKSREQVRAVMYDGCVNAIRATGRARNAKFVLLSVIGPDKPSWVWGLLGMVKRGMKKNVIDREQALIGSGLPYVICRAPKLNDKTGGVVAIAATTPTHRLDMKMGISRTDLATALICAAKAAPDRTTWDVFADPQGPVPDWLHSST